KSPCSYSSPTRVIAAIRPSSSSVAAETPAASPSAAFAAASFACPDTTPPRSPPSTSIVSSLSAQWVGAVVVHGLVQRDDVLDRHAGLQVVDRAEHEAAAGPEDAHALPDLRAHLLGRAEREHGLRLDAAAPEGDAVAEGSLQLGRVHLRRRRLHRVEDVEAGLDEVVEQAPDRAVGVHEALPGGVRMDPLVHTPVERLEQVAV